MPWDHHTLIFVEETVAGQLHCKDCGHFFAGQRGLQDHQRQKHNKAGCEADDAMS